MKKNKNTIIETAKQTIIDESNAIANLVNFLTEDFEKAVNFIHNSNGRLIVTGIGKSAKIGDKIVATLNSTGTPAIFMHAADILLIYMHILIDGDDGPGVFRIFFSLA